MIKAATMTKNKIVQNKIESNLSHLNYIESSYESASKLSQLNVVCGYDEEHERLIELFRKFYSNYSEHLKRGESCESF